MKNEITRKLTSLTLLTILLASGVTFAVPGSMPAAEAAHNANLFVSAESSIFKNTFGGPMVVEIVINDPALTDTDEGKGEPDVTINGKDVRMAQATDGLWYAYVADRTQAQNADSLVGATGGLGTDFGTFCPNTTSLDAGAVSTSASFTDTVGIAVSGDVGGAGGSQGTAPITTACGAVAADIAGSPNVNVVREEKSLNTNPATGNGAGQLDLTVAAWPFIQLYDFNPTGSVEIKYNKGGGTQTTTLTFDTMDTYAKLSLDRSTYTTGSEVHVTLVDGQLNIDPTDEDSWTFGTAAPFQTRYQLFNENGATEGDVAGGSNDISASLTALMFEDNGIVKLNGNVQGGPSIVDLDANNDQGASFVDIASPGGLAESTTLLAIGTQPMTFVETGANTGTYTNYDENDDSNLDVIATAARGTSASIDYNKKATSIVVGFGFGTLSIAAPTNGVWNSGEEIAVTLVDSDANKNSRADEDLDVFNPLVTLIPSLRIGTPVTLSGVPQTGVPATLPQLVTVAAIDGTGIAGPGTAGRIVGVTPAFVAGSTAAPVDRFSDIARINLPAGTAIIPGVDAADTDGGRGLLIDLGTTFGNLQNNLVNSPAAGPGGIAGTAGFNLINFDVRGITTQLTGTSVSNFDVYLLIEPAGGPFLPIPGGGYTAIKLAETTTPQALSSITPVGGALAGGLGDLAIFPLVADPTVATPGVVDTTDPVGLLIIFDTATAASAIPLTTVTTPVTADFFAFGIRNDGERESERVNNAIYRFELEESGDNTGTFIGTAEYTMLNQVNIFNAGTYAGLRTVDDEVTFIVHDDLDDEDAPRINYLDLGADGVSTQIADQKDAATNSGTVAFDKDSYKIADTVTVTVNDSDLNVDSDLIDIYVTVVPGRAVSGSAAGTAITVGATDPAEETVGVALGGTGVYTDGTPIGRLLDITFDDEKWASSRSNADTTAGSDCTDLELANGAAFDDGLADAGFTLIETGTDTGVFKGDFQIPSIYCSRAAIAGGATITTLSTTGTDIEVNYVDFRDASGEIIEVGDGAGVRANTGSVSFDRTVYPVPFGAFADYTATPVSPTTQSYFPTHLTAITATGAGLAANEVLPQGTVNVHIRVNDPDFDISAAGEDIIATLEPTNGPGNGPLLVSVTRGSARVDLATAGAPVARAGHIIDTAANLALIRELGPIKEIAPNAGIFELDLPIEHTDGPVDTSKCPTTNFYDVLLPTAPAGAGPEDRFIDTVVAPGSLRHCVLQGDILTVQYTDATDATGNLSTVTDSATFDLRNGVLQSDKSVYIIGSDAILTLIEPDFDLDSDSAETFTLDLIEWDSDADTVSMGPLGLTAASFDPEPSAFRETGDNTGIFQVVVEIPNNLNGERLDRGEEIELEYTDWGPAGADYVGDEDEDVNLTIYTSNFGATVELDQKVYTWTDKVFITIVAPDHNFDSNLIDEIGDTNIDKVAVSTRGTKLTPYKLAETGTDTGIFTGEVILTGFAAQDADGDGTPGDATGAGPSGTGPTDGFLPADDDDGITVSFEFTEDETVVGSALVRWNIGEVQFLEASYPATGQGVLRVVDPDMNFNPEAIDNFDVDVWSDSDAGGIDLTVTETNEATGIFEGTVHFTVTDESSGHRLRVAEGDTVTGEYEDNTLPSPYTTADELEIAATTFIGSIVPPLERAPASNPRIVDAFGNELDEVSVDQQVQITADLANGQDRDQPFAYLVQIQDEDGVTVSLSWITGSLAPGQTLNPAQSWTPTSEGSYNVQIFVWESVDNPDALSPPVSTTISVV
ncbi:MAG TPA: hypothetical protein VD699_04470 [Nitrosopumilaceae archaeon]|nr:hypothetical protein [Nitrosopumilaceae archaeon]